MQRLHFYPFNKASKIELIAFDWHESTPVHHKIVNEKKVIEKVILNKRQTDSLTSLLYNVGYSLNKKFVLGDPGAACYEPRNSILFLDKNGKAFEYLEICFECRKIVRSSELLNDGQYCSTKFELLREFFNSLGIQYGTARSKEKEDTILSYDRIFKLDTSQILRCIYAKLYNKASNGKNLNKLNKTEQTIFLLENAYDIQEGYDGLSGLAQFYFSDDGEFYSQTIDALKLVGANKTLYVLEQSKNQWPNKIIPSNLQQRRAILLSFVNKADPQWAKLEATLNTQKDDHIVQREDLNDLIFKFAMAHRSELKD